MLCRAGVTYVSDTMSQMTDNTNTPFPDVPWSDWQIDARDIQIVQRPNGKDWLLGGGAFGQVRFQYHPAAAVSFPRLRRHRTVTWC